ncbi:MAG TPA: AgmX/PglI C-terminal domain-containing protein, partial [Povalibacter sp.]|nr:AgmX/PglI C-terminal domain-containing protein [Povalibacter sp.]
FIVFAVTALVIPWLPVPEKPRHAAPAIPDRVVRLAIEKQPPPPPPPVRKAEPEPAPKPVDQVVQPRPVSAARPLDARAKAQNSGLLKLQDQLADLRDNAILDKAVAARNLTGKVAESASAERSYLTASVGVSSGGIDTAALSRGYGGGAGSLTGHETTQVASSSLAAKANDGVQRGAGSTKASRSREEIELVFDRNKSSIYALYSRALRDKPDLKGKLVLELTIAPGGEVTQCRIVSSELNDPDLERKLVARVRSFRFEARDVASITTTKPIDFFPA